MRCYLAALCLLGVQPAVGQTAESDWPSRKCEIYAAAWTQALDAFGSDEMNYAFIAGNENFIAGGCEQAGEICPQSRQELDIANAMTLAMMNAGTASTFLPFNCPRVDPAESGWSGPGL